MIFRSYLVMRFGCDAERCATLPPSTRNVMQRHWDGFRPPFVRPSPAIQTVSSQRVNVWILLGILIFNHILSLSGQRNNHKISTNLSKCHLPRAYRCLPCQIAIFTFVHISMRFYERRFICPVRHRHRDGFFSNYSNFSARIIDYRKFTCIFYPIFRFSFFCAFFVCRFSISIANSDNRFIHLWHWWPLPLAFPSTA